MQVKRGHIEAVRKQAEFFVKLSDKLSDVEQYQEESRRLKGRIEMLEKELRDVKAENEMLFNNLLQKSDYIYKLENKL